MASLRDGKECNMITKEQALTEDMFHDKDCRRWRRNGKTQTWKTRPDEFRVPVKFGLYAYDQLTHLEAKYDGVHIPGDPEFKCGRA